MYILLCLILYIPDFKLNKIKINKSNKNQNKIKIKNKL